MKNILVLNCGSSSVKYELFNIKRSVVLARGLVERVGMEDAVLHYHYLKNDGSYDDIKRVENIPTHREAIQLIISSIKDDRYGVIEDINDIYGIGHRVVHGGEKYTDSVYITPEVKNDIKNYISLAPLHNPHHLVGIEACEDLIPDHPQVAVFDTAFHQSMPEEAYMYAFPYDMYKKFGIRKYGFHGTSHKYVSHRAACLIKKKLTDLKIISCHLGNGASVCAVKNGKSVETSMGFTPLAGLIMGTRTGDFDPAILLYIMNKEALSLSEANSMINRHSGLYGISGVSRDFREVIEKCHEGHERAELAVKMYAYRIKHYIGAYAAIMNGVDLLVFTAGIGENSGELREMVCKDMDYLGIKLDKKKNVDCIAEEGIISAGKNPVTIMCVPTDEEFLIAEETNSIIEERKK
ncbi:MAG: acetate kinase [Elusimicrobiota bacterium]|nr:acetate kinase [Elusimicrobiota bacterium]